jgi:hypothetical protein
MRMGASFHFGFRSRLASRSSRVEPAIRAA